MFKKHLLSLKRYQTSENRDVLNGIILDRNERADHFSKKNLNILKKIPRYSINATPIFHLYINNYHHIINYMEITFMLLKE